MTKPERIVLTALDRSVEVRTDAHPMRSLLLELWHPFITGEDGAPEWVEVMQRDGEWSVRGSLDHSEDIAMTWEALLLSRNLITQTLLGNRADLVLIHAATVFMGRDAALIVGPAGTGKTTLCADLCRGDGWDYGSDDVAPIDLSSGLLYPFPRPPAFKGMSLTLDDFAERWVPPKDLEQPSGPFLVPPVALGAVAHSPLLPTLMVFPSFQMRSPGVASRLAPAEAVKAMLTEVYDPSGETMSFVTGLCRRIPAYRIEYETSEKALALLSELPERR